MSDKVDLKKYTDKYVTARRETLMTSAGSRNRQMDKYEKAYRMDVWKDARLPGEERVTLPIAYAMVEESRALMFARKPQYSVPSLIETVDVERAQQLEAYLAGFDSMVDLYNKTYEAEWNAQCLGEGGLKVWYDPESADDDFPIAVRSVNPRDCYYRFNTQGTRFSEFVHTYLRTRREIEDEYGTPLKSNSRPTGANVEELEQWLEEKVEYTEYWSEHTVVEKRKQTPEDKARELMAALMDDGNGPLAETIANPENEMADDRNKTSRKRRIVHCAFLPDENYMREMVWIKKPCVMVGYETIPFFYWGGIPTGIQGQKWVSGLYAVMGGDGGNNADGVLNAHNQVMSLFLSASYKATFPAKVTSSKTIMENGLDYAPDAINYIEDQKSVTSIQEAQPGQSMMTIIEQIKQMIGRVGTPEVMTGGYVNNSGASISGQSTVFMLRLTAMQHERETALRRMMEHVLTLTREYAGSAGWSTYGQNRYSKFANATVKSEDIGDSVRVSVKLSSSFPRDDIALITMMSNLVGQRRISKSTFMDFFQQIYGLAADSPEMEAKRILAETYTDSPEVAQMVGATMAQQLQQEIGAMPPPKSAEQPPAAPPGEGVEGSMPPVMPEGVEAPPAMQNAPLFPAAPAKQSYVPGQAPTREDVAAAGNLQGSLNMIGGSVAQSKEVSNRR